MSVPSNKQRVVKDATRSITVRITPQHVRLAKCGDPAECVIAQALTAALGDMLEGVQVGSTIIKVYVPGKVLRYTTPAAVRRAIPVFDKTGQWSLPPGEYTLSVPSTTAKLGGRPNRWAKHRTGTNKSGRDMFRARNLPTRQVMRATCNVEV